MSFERMSGNVETECSFFSCKQLRCRPSFRMRRNLIGVISLLWHAAKETRLALHPFSLHPLSPAECHVDQTEKGSAPFIDRPAILHRVKSARADETLENPLIQRRGIHPFGKVEER